MDERLVSVLLIALWESEFAVSRNGFARFGYFSSFLVLASGSFNQFSDLLASVWSMGRMLVSFFS